MPSKLHLAQILEAILFVAVEPVSLRQLATSSGQSSANTKQALEDLSQHLQQRGIRLVTSRNRYSLVTHPAARQVVEKFLGQEAKSELSKPALETLAVIAYKQPISRSQIDEIRGVSSEQTIRNLLSKELITESMPKQGPKLYHTSVRFLQAFGLNHPNELPPLTPPDKK